MATATKRASRRARAETTTHPEPVAKRLLARSRSGRRAIVAALVLFVAAGLSGYLGPKTATETARGDGYTVVVTYPEVTRPGLPVRWEYSVTHPGGFDGPVTLATTFNYLHLFDLTNIEPEPTQATSTGDAVIYRFARPAGEVLRVSMDAAAESGFHEAPPTVTRVIVGGSVVVTVEFTTRVVP